MEKPLYAPVSKFNFARRKVLVEFQAEYLLKEMIDADNTRKTFSVYFYGRQNCTLVCTGIVH